MDEGLDVVSTQAPLAEAPAAPQLWPLSERPGFLARRMHQIHVSLFSERCAAFGVTPLQYSLLSLLRDLREADQTTLANAVALDRTTTTGALKRLAARGLVSRSTSPTDRRAQICRLTDEGEALHGAMEPAARAAHALTVAGLTPAERAHLTLEGGIELIHSVGGLASIAHPYETDGLMDLLPGLVQSGLDAVECYYTGYGPDRLQPLLDFVKANDLIASGGSDFHGFPMAGLTKVTTEPGSVDVPESVIDGMQNRLAHRR